jgi:hypothetical protein
MEIKSLRLKTGEVIACGVEDNLDLEGIQSKRFLTIYKPVLFNSFKFLNPQQQVVETISMSPFMNTSIDDSYEISSDQVVNICNVRPLALERYKDYVRYMQQDAEMDFSAMTEEQEMLDDIILDAMEEKNHSNLH